MRFIFGTGAGAAGATAGGGEVDVVGAAWKSSKSSSVVASQIPHLHGSTPKMLTTKRVRKRFAVCSRGCHRRSRRRCAKVVIAKAAQEVHLGLFWFWRSGRGRGLGGCPPWWCCRRRGTLRERARAAHRRFVVARIVLFEASPRRSCVAEATRRASTVVCRALFQLLV